MTRLAHAIPRSQFGLAALGGYNTAAFNISGLFTPRRVAAETPGRRLAQYPRLKGKLILEGD